MLAIVIDPKNVLRGKEALIYFHNRMLSYPIYNVGSFEALCDYMEKISPNFLNGFGKALSYNSSGTLTTARIKKAMEGLADAAKGNLPRDGKGALVFWDAIYDLTTPSVATWGVITKNAVAETIDDVATYSILGIGAVSVIAIGALACYIIFLRRG